MCRTKITFYMDNVLTSCRIQANIELLFFFADSFIIALFIIYVNIHFIIIFISLDLTPDKIVFVVLSQPNSFHTNRAEEFRKHFTEQLDSIDKVSMCVPMIHNNTENVFILFRIQSNLY